MNMRILRSLFFVVALAAALAASAVPAKRVSRTVVQPDGTALTVVLRGDEHFHYLATTDGQPVAQAADGSFRYAVLTNGRLAPSNLQAHEPDLRSEAERQFVAANRTTLFEGIRQVRQQRQARVNERRAQRRTNGLAAGTSSRVPGLITDQTYSGEFRQLVILVNFSDTKMKHTASEWNNQFNQQGYNKNGHIGSVRDYFLDQSYGQLDLDFDVAGPYTVSKSVSYYGANDSEGNDKYAGALVAEACQLAAADGVDFSKYDWNGDGEVEQVIVMYAGYGEASGAAAYTIWPHQYYLSYSDYGKTYTSNGVKVDAYAVFQELSGTSGTQMDGIGTFCHEFSHCLGLPDFYDTEGDNFGMSTWSLLDYGCYNGPAGYEGSVPCAFTAYERACEGWLNLQELSEGCSVKNMAAITDSAQAYIIYNEAKTSEFYILDNHQQTSWDTYAYGHGLLITHVDYDARTWYNNEVNNTASHQRCTIVPADNSLAFTLSGLAGDPWPGTRKNTALTNTSSPAATLFNANSDGTKYLNKPITGIAESDGLISFTFNGGISIDTPEALPATDLTLSATDGNAFTAHWTAVPAATSYTLEVNEKSQAAGEILLSEDFATLGDGSHQNAGVDYSSKLDEVLSSTGWTGTKLFTGVYKNNFYGIKLGSGSATGTLTTPTIAAPSSGVATLYFVCTTYPNDELGLQVSGKGGASLAGVYTEEGAYAVSIPDVTDSFQISFSTTSSAKRAFIGAVALFDGEVSQEDAEAALDAQVSPRRTLYHGLFEGLTDTLYTVEGLTATSYTYRVKAVTADGESGWSKRVSVLLDGSDPSLAIIGLHGASQHPQATSRGIYDLTGRRVTNPTEGGLYIVDGQKVWIKK